MLFRSPFVTEDVNVVAESSQDESDESSATASQEIKPRGSMKDGRRDAVEFCHHPQVRGLPILG